MKQIIHPSPVATIFSALNHNKEHFGATGISSSDAKIGMGILIGIVILSIIVIILSLVAINKVFSLGTQESKRYKVIAYIAWLITGGSIGWIFILMWLFGVKM